MAPQTLTGPFSQIVTMAGLPKSGPITDQELQIIPHGGLVHENGIIVKTGPFDEMKKNFPDALINEISEPAVALPGLIDCHTHLCFAGSRARDYALRLAGKSYLEIAKEGGGILNTVHQTRAATEEELESLLLKRCEKLLQNGVTTCEIKSGYGLSTTEELKILNTIANAQKKSRVDLVPTCLAAHMRPPEFFDNRTYLKDIVENLLPVVKQKNLCRRVDVFVEDSAFNTDEARWYLKEAKKLGFAVTVHADQFSTGGSAIAAKAGAVSADHLEASGTNELKMLKSANVVAVALPGASLGLGIKFAPARQILDEGLTLAMASDWNPGSAPMGDLLTQAALLGAFEKLTMAETLAGITARAAMALGLTDRGELADGKLADFISFATGDWREILYHQGQLGVAMVWKQGKHVQIV